MPFLVLSFLGAFLGQFLLDRLFFWLLKNRLTGTAKVWVSNGLALQTAIIVGGSGYVLDGWSDRATFGVMMWVLAQGICVVIDLLALRGQSRNFALAGAPIERFSHGPEHAGVRPHAKGEERTIMRKERWLIAALAALLIWFGNAIVRLENYHYANQIGMCTEATFEGPLNLVAREDCLASKHTRTSALWHLLYGLRVL